MSKNEVRSVYLSPCTKKKKNNLNNIAKTLQNFATCEGFLKRSPIAQRVSQSCQIQLQVIKNFCKAKQSWVCSMKKVFANYPLDRDLIARIYKDL